MQQLQTWLEECSLNSGYPDRVVWKTGATDFSVKSCYALLAETQGSAEHSGIPNVWSRHGTPKSKAFLWLACQDRILTKGRLRRLNLLRAEDLLCPNCDKDEENADHTLLQCSFAWRCWSAVMFK